ncbi:hypothetical protein B0I29_1185 [Actinoplanes lutulentus]|uniref:Uncharacterized protein n=2 Tax=Actinoplanes lutulentus TaxID=1287878 RepID=A0A327Z7B1_9ACTN|nr:hypothetical protein B0I29_1185 [Actinoplanes lutulentus]
MEAPQSLTDLPTRVWDDDEWKRIKLGYAARGMDEKWDVLVEGQVAYLHRSWTGFAVFEVTFSSVKGGWRISEALVESAQSRQRRGSHRYARVLLELVLSNVVLGEPAIDLRDEMVALLTSKPGNAEVPTAAIEQSVIGLRSYS